MLSTRDPPQNERYAQTKRMGEKIHSNGNEKSARVVILIFNKIDFKTKAI